MSDPLEKLSIKDLATTKKSVNSALNTLLEWRSCKDEYPVLGQKVLLFSNNVIQNEIYEYDTGDECGSFWSRDDLDECPLVDENDWWFPVDELPKPL